MSLRAAIRAELATLDASGVEPFDVHAHTGADLDGTVRSCEEHLRDLDEVGGRSVVFPLCVSGGYAVENRRVLDECRRHPRRLVPFARLDPRVDGAPQAAQALAAGARGFKLHPRAEEFRLEHSGVAEIVGVAAMARAPVLIHAGLGIGRLGGALLDLAERHRDCPIVLAHAAISDLCWLAPESVAHPNLFFDTSWWNPADLLALFAAVPPGRILFGSDAPYMDPGAVLAITLRCARFAGLSEEAVRLLAGAQLERLLAGEAPLEAESAPGPPPVAPSPAACRAATAIAAAGGAKLGGGDPAQMLELARLALGGDGACLGDPGRVVAALLEEGAAVTRQAPWALAMALTLLLTPGAEEVVPVG